MNCCHGDDGRALWSVTMRSTPGSKVRPTLDKQRRCILMSDLSQGLTHTHGLTSRAHLSGYCCFNVTFDQLNATLRNKSWLIYFLFWTQTWHVVYLSQKRQKCIIMKLV